MNKIIRFKKEKPFFEIQESLMNKLGKDFSKYFVGNPKEIKKGLQRSFFPYKNVSENLKILPYYFDGKSSINLCISCDTRYIDGSIISPKLKIAGIYVETPWNESYSLELDEIVKAINSWWYLSKSSSLF